MSKILHVVNSFDPAGDVVRCVVELKKYSRHQHELIVKDIHPFQSTYQFPVPEHLESNTSSEFVRGQFDWADAILYHFVGWERGWALHGDKPCAFRNLNIYWDKAADKFFSAPYYNAGPLDRYKLLASSHQGAQDFLPGCRMLPDLIPIHDPAYMPNWEYTGDGVAYIKHADALRVIKPKWVSLYQNAHPMVLYRRRYEASAIIDNICDGHYGLSGLEGMSAGLATVVFNHAVTRAVLHEMAPEYPPFAECAPTVSAAIARAIVVAGDMGLRKASRQWMEEYYHSSRIIQKYWDIFLDELVS